MKWTRRIPEEILDDERSWQGDHDPYLARLAHKHHAGRPPARPPGPSLSGPPDDGDPYLAQLARSGRGAETD